MTPNFRRKQGSDRLIPYEGLTPNPSPYSLAQGLHRVSSLWRHGRGRSQGDVEDWWGPLMGRGKAFDSKRFFIFCANFLGSPYGTASPVTINPDTGKPYGPEFPPTSIRDDVRLHKIVLDHLGVSSVAVAIGGSLGGMAILEWPLCTPPGYIRRVVPIATCARHSAWCISWGEVQRQSIYSDPTYNDGFYETQPTTGLAAARMAAMMTYRSRDGFERRFGRKVQTFDPAQLLTPRSPEDDALVAHNDGHQKARRRAPPSVSARASPTRALPLVFTTQSYLRYQGNKFTSRFDANCYIHITRKMDTHDVARGRLLAPDEDESAALARVLATLPPHALVIGIHSDALFPLSEQREIAAHVPGAELVVIPSPEGHDGFLLEFELINGHILRFLKREFSEYYPAGEVVEEPEEGFAVKKTSLFGEAEVDATRTAWSKTRL
ncbi:homoserine O-acetyltransferase [Amylocystis lapponica]|nr:homoserine O-acetyltransferase [Amylocystis lapponica]